MASSAKGTNAGTPGLDGLDGTPGFPGATGATGTAGVNGATGPTGTAGTAGATGASGSDGIAGLDGQPGPVGATGPQGIQGTTGPTGTQGTTGPTGTAGTIGVDGTPGLDGQPGYTGATGATGTAGTAGATGNTGATGGKAAAVIYVPAAAMWPSITTGAQTPTQTEAATNKVNYITIDFDQTTQEFAEFTIAMPSDWDAGTITAQFWWTATGTSTNSVVWALEGRSLGDSETIDQSQTGAQQVADAHTATASQAQLTAATPAITLTGANASDLCFFRVKRVPADGSDTLAADAQLIGVVINYTRA